MGAVRSLREHYQQYLGSSHCHLLELHNFLLAGPRICNRVLRCSGAFFRSDHDYFGVGGDACHVASFYSLSHAPQYRFGVVGLRLISKGLRLISKDRNTVCAPIAGQLSLTPSRHGPITPRPHHATTPSRHDPHHATDPSRHDQSRHQSTSAPGPGFCLTRTFCNSHLPPRFVRDILHWRQEILHTVRLPRLTSAETSMPAETR